MMMSFAHGTALPASSLVLVTVAAVGLYFGGGLSATPAVMASVSFALLVFGLPHGTFDLALLRRATDTGSPATATFALLVLYIGCAGAMYFVWRLSPVIALAAFLIMAVAHFAEDWEACGSRFIAGGVALAIVAAPALLHGQNLGDLFILLTGDVRAGVLAELLLLVAPMAVAVALVGLWLLWQARQPALAVALGCSLAAMLLLPPVIGFALFFCLVHSPRQFRQHTESLGLHGFRQWGGIVVPLSLGGLGIAVAVFLLNGVMPIAANVFASSFMTLAILTAPHMIVPLIADRYLSPQLLARA
jgi:Brp/Blh family beta-carotene 15,15'-monooxygenase